MNELEAIDNVARLIQRWCGVERDVALVGAVVLLSIPDSRITSGYRSPQANRAVGGVPGSYHVKRRGLDIVVPRLFVRQAMDIGVQHRCIEVLDEGDHVHFAR